VAEAVQPNHDDPAEDTITEAQLVAVLGQVPRGTLLLCVTAFSIQIGEAEDNMSIASAP